MDINPEDLLSTPANYATPDQLKQLRDYGSALMYGKGQQPVGHWAQGLSNMVAALVGGNIMKNMGTSDIASRQWAGSQIGATNPLGVSDSTNAAPGTAASVRNNNPGAQWPGPTASAYGATGYQNLKDGNKIATFDDPVKGAAAQFALLDRKYSGRPLSDAISEWSGGNSSASYTQRVAQETGLSPNTIITPDLLRGPMGIKLAKAMSHVEAGGEFPLPDEGWTKAQALAFSGKPSAASIATPGGQTAAAVPSIGPPMPTKAGTTSDSTINVDPHTVPFRPQVGRQQISNIFGAAAPYLSPEAQNAYLQMYLMQGQPVTADLGYGNTGVFPAQGNGVGRVVPGLHTIPMHGPEGMGTDILGTIGPGGQFQSIPGLPQFPSVPKGPAFNPATAPPIGPQSAITPPQKATTAMAGATSPMGAVGPAAGPQGAPPAQYASLEPTTKTDAAPGMLSTSPNMPGMLNTPPPAVPSVGQPQGTQVAQNNPLQNMADFGIDYAARKGVAQEQSKKYVEDSMGIQDTVTAATKGLQELSLAQQAMNNKNFYSGFASDLVLPWKKFRAAIGDDPNAAAAMEAFDKVNSNEVLTLMKQKLSGLGQVRVAELNLLNRASPNLMNTVAGNKIVMQVLQRFMEQGQKLGDVVNAYDSGGEIVNGKWAPRNGAPTATGLNNTINQYLRNTPIFSPEDIKYFNQQLDTDARFKDTSSPADKNNAAIDRIYGNRQNSGPAGTGAQNALDEAIKERERRRNLQQQP